MNARNWLADVREHADPHLSCILVGNKVDLCEPPESAPPSSTHPLKQRQVTTEEASQWALEQGLLFVEASAKSGHNVDRAFEDASRDILDKIQRGVFDDDRVGGVSRPRLFLFSPPFSPSPSPPLFLFLRLISSPPFFRLMTRPCFSCAVTWRQAVQACKWKSGTRSRVHAGSVLFMMSDWCNSGNGCTGCMHDDMVACFRILLEQSTAARLRGLDAIYLRYMYNRIGYKYM